MISTYQRLQRQRDAGEIDGFTLIELLIVIVVLGILAAVVIFALGGITGKSAVASCQADGATVSTALAAFNAQNPTLLTNAPGSSTTSPNPPLTVNGTTIAGAAADYTYYTPTVTNGVVTSWALSASNAANAVGDIAIPTLANAADSAALEALLSSSASTYQGPYIQSWPNSPSHYGYVLAWTQTGAGASGTPSTWSAQLYVVTGSTYKVGNVTGPVAVTYASGPINGNLSQTIINSATPVGATTTGTAIVGLYSYAGPSVCTAVS
jgi:general secretion pathway protein G